VALQRLAGDCIAATLDTPSYTNLSGSYRRAGLSLSCQDRARKRRCDRSDPRPLPLGALRVLDPSAQSRARHVLCQYARGGQDMDQTSPPLSR